MRLKNAKVKYGKSLKIISFPKNLGKREAMAEGVLISTGDIIVFVDSDSFLKKHSLKDIVEHFMIDKKIGAVSGNSFVHNAEVNTLTKMQSARYGVSFDIFKAAESVFGTVTCCPGCFSAYRKQAILDVLERWRNQTFLGTRSTFGDDRSLTNFVLRTWKVIYCRKATASTIAPENYRQFFKQQLRWKKSWVREGANAGSFIWKKNPIASISFYINLIIPIFGPVIVVKVFVFDLLFNQKSPLMFISGVFVMSLLFGIYYYFIYQNKYWWYTSFFTLMYTFILVWQMPYALLKLNDTRWGTR
jgi:hyaluronan synthase